MVSIFTAQISISKLNEILSKSQTASFMGTENNSYRIIKDYMALLIDHSWKRTAFEGSNLFISKHITKLNQSKNVQHQQQRQISRPVEHKRNSRNKPVHLYSQAVLTAY